MCHQKPDQPSLLRSECDDRIVGQKKANQPDEQCQHKQNPEQPLSCGVAQQRGRKQRQREPEQWVVGKGRKKIPMQDAESGAGHAAAGTGNPGPLLDGAGDAGQKQCSVDAADHEHGNEITQLQGFLVFHDVAPFRLTSSSVYCIFMISSIHFNNLLKNSKVGHESVAFCPCISVSRCVSL